MYSELFGQLTGVRLREKSSMKKLLCWIGIHNWGPEENIRDDKADPLLLFTPFLLMAVFFGMPKICDRKCSRCGKVKEFKYNP